MMERIIPTSMTGTINATYAQGLQTYANYITSKGAYAIIDPHNFGRYYGNLITDYTGFQAFVCLPSYASLLAQKVVRKNTNFEKVENCRRALCNKQQSDLRLQQRAP
jgi:endoglucanase